MDTCRAGFDAVAFVLLVEIVGFGGKGIDRPEQTSRATRRTSLNARPCRGRDLATTGPAAPSGLAWARFACRALYRDIVGRGCLCLALADCSLLDRDGGLGGPSFIGSAREVQVQAIRSEESTTPLPNHRGSPPASPGGSRTFGLGRGFREARLGTGKGTRAGTGKRVGLRRFDAQGEEAERPAAQGQGGCSRGGGCRTSPRGLGASWPRQVRSRRHASSSGFGRFRTRRCRGLDGSIRSLRPRGSRGH